ncbi:MAG: lysozyme-like domain-containing protein [Piptocephalis tieghemiana]|nr:MAG: lysozyme-like domain-containing protein [Piptocephalis tieghemiana]
MIPYSILLPALGFLIIHSVQAHAIASNPEVVKRDFDNGLWYPGKYEKISSTPGAPGTTTPATPPPQSPPGGPAGAMAPAIPGALVPTTPTIPPPQNPSETSLLGPSSMIHAKDTPHSKRESTQPTDLQFISFTTLEKVMSTTGYPIPSKDQYHAFVQSVGDAGITTALEASMYLAHLLWESQGLQEVVERACKSNGCPGAYISELDVKGKRYYGRGYIQLTWAKNYLEASRGIYGDDRLLKQPELVAEDVKTAWGTAAWYWKARVHEAAKSGQFGRTTLEINGNLECGVGGSGGVQAARGRYALFTMIAPILGVTGPLNEGGCY